MKTNLVKIGVSAIAFAFVMLVAVAYLAKGFPGLTVADNITLAIGNLGVPGILGVAILLLVVLVILVRYAPDNFSGGTQ